MFYSFKKTILKWKSSRNYEKGVWSCINFNITLDKDGKISIKEKKGGNMYGLVLEGGGARGSYHAGVYKAIQEVGLEIGGIAGSSIGALNGAMILQDDYDKCHELWHDLSYSMVFNIDDDEIEKMKKLTLSKEDLNFVGQKLKRFIVNGGLDITCIKALMDKYIDEEKIRKTQKDFGIVTVNLTAFKSVEIFLEDIPRGDLKKYLLASAYLPFFKFERIDGNIYLDGGFYDNLPYRMLMDKGYTDLILVRTHAPGFTRKIDLKDTNSIVISPSDDIGKTYTYEAKSSRRNIKLGYLDGLRAFRGLVGEKYYVKPNNKDDFYLNYLLNVEEYRVRQLEELLKLEKIPYRRSLLENIVPKLCDYLGIDKNCTYEYLVVLLLEKSALKYNVERFEIYEFQQLLSLVQSNMVENKMKKDLVEEEIKLKGITKIIDKVESLSIFNKVEILMDVGDILFNPLKQW